MTNTEQVVDPALVPLDRVASWMDGVELGSGPLEDVTVLSGGTQNVLLRFTRNGREYVLRRPPEHKRSNSDETMLREAMVLNALRDSDVPHPRFIAGCSDMDVIGSVFYLMEPVAGFNPAMEVPEWYTTDPEAQRRLGLAVVDGLLALARVSPAEVGLSGLGRPNGWLERQVPRWRRQLHGYTQVGYSLEALPGVDSVERWLLERQPRQGRLGLIHGDFHIANVLLGRQEPVLEAVVDWELTTQGDPLLDLGHLLATWPNEDSAAGVVLAAALGGLPTRAEVTEYYARHSGRDIEDIRWFRVLACYRLAVILEGTYTRSRAGKEPDDIGEIAHQRALALIDQARELTRGE